jgi:predicted enzyme related to lactoylglutathione lyase
MATISDPEGAAVSLWQPKKHIGAGIVNIPGAMSWNELYVKDVEKAKTFYGSLFGWTYDFDPKSGYTTIRNNGRSNGGIFKLTDEFLGVPPNWTVYFTVSNLDESLAKVKELGGEVGMGPKTIGVGKIAMISDPAKAHFMIMELSIPPSAWIE